MKISQGDLSYYALKSRDSSLVVLSFAKRFFFYDPFWSFFFALTFVFLFFFRLDHRESLFLVVADCDN